VLTRATVACAECYFSEQDRCQRIKAVQKSPEKEELWAKLTKHDRRALHFLRQSVVSKQVEYRDDIGWITPGADSHERSPLHSPAGLGLAPMSPRAPSSPGERGESARRPSKLPKRKQRNLAKFFAEDDDDGGFGSKLVQRSKSSDNLPELNAGEEGSNAAFSRIPSEDGADGVSKKSITAFSLQDKLDKTKHWKPKEAGVVGRTKFERVSTPRLDGKTLRQPGGDDVCKCPMPSAVCLHRHKPIPKGRMTTMYYRQILAVLAPEAKSVVQHILSKGAKKRVGPDTYAPGRKADESKASQSGQDSTAELEMPLLPQPSAETAGAPKLRRSSLASAKHLTHSTKTEALDGEVKATEFDWKGKPDDLILSTLLRVQQGSKQDAVWMLCSEDDWRYLWQNLSTQSRSRHQKEEEEEDFIFNLLIFRRRERPLFVKEIDVRMTGILHLELF